MLQETVEYGCPYCASEISTLVDLTQGSQQYIEDCEICCRPINLYYSVEPNLNLGSFQALAEDA